VTPSRRELSLREQFPNPHEHQLSFFRSHELHPAESHPGVAAAIVGKDDLIGRQRHSEAIRKDHERARRAVSDDAKRRRPVALPQENRGRGKFDEERDVLQPTDATIPAK